MKRVLFIQHGDVDRIGLLGTVLEERGIAIDTVHSWRGEPVPDDPRAWDGIAVGGGAMSAYQTEEFPFLNREKSLLQRAREYKMPVLGMCLGAQLMAAAFGGKVFQNQSLEIGFFEVRFTQAAEGDPLWEGRAQPFQPVHWHGDTFSLPPDAVLLASSELTPHQLFRLDEKLYGFQFHLEIDRPILAEMIADDEEGLRKHGVDPALLLEKSGQILPGVEVVAREVFTRWSEMLT